MIANPTTSNELNARFVGQKVRRERHPIDLDRRDVDVWT